MSSHVDRRLIDKLVHEITYCELHACEHAMRETKRLGEVAPVLALRAVAEHASHMRPRLNELLDAYEIALGKHWLGSKLASLRVVVERIGDAERAFRNALLDLRHGVDLVRLLRETARREVVFGVIRWCDDWLGARRTLVARVEAQLEWYAQHAEIDPTCDSNAIGIDAIVPPPGPDDDDWHADRTT